MEHAWPYILLAQTAAPVGGGRAWPGFETTRRAAYQQLASLVWRAPEGPEGTGGLRGAAPNEVRSPSLAGGRALRRPEHPWGHTATQQHGTPARHNKTARPQWGRAAVAVALGFEPRVAVTPHSISSAAPSAARTRYLTRILYYTLPLRAQIDRAGWEQGHIAVWEQGPA